ncbi:MAG: hypothetical protein CMF46_00950 [Legionellales bacterium]|nr:hypothetical protein [Legionellales bacterium]
MTDLIHSAAYQQAMRWLKRREYSGVEMQQRLTEKGYCDSEIQSVIDDLVANGYLDNTRFVDQLVRNTQAKRNGPLWLDHMIAKHQVGDVDLESILADLAVDWYGQALEFVRKKKFFLGDEQRCYRSLWKKGYCDDMIKSVLKQLKCGGESSEH